MPIECFYSRKYFMVVTAIYQHLHDDKEEDKKRGGKNNRKSFPFNLPAYFVSHYSSRSRVGLFRIPFVHPCLLFLKRTTPFSLLWQNC